MDRAAIQRIAEEFWAQVGEPEPFPRLLEPAVLWVLPLAVFKLPRLWVRDVQGWLAARGVRFQLETGDRPLHGCLFAFGGRGCVLLNGGRAGLRLGVPCSGSGTRTSCAGSEVAECSTFLLRRACQENRKGSWWSQALFQVVA